MTAPDLNLSLPDPTSPFVARHIGPGPKEVREMLAAVDADALDSLIGETVPAQIRLRRPLQLPPALSESEALAELESLAQRNLVLTSLIGQGYHNTFTPPVIQRAILESPAWYTPYTPYQAEIAQGRLEALLNFQTLIADFTGLPLANASMLDEGTAAAEAMTMCHRAAEQEERRVFWVSERCHPQTIAVVKTRAIPQGIEVRVASDSAMEFGPDCFGALTQLPGTDGGVSDLSAWVERVHAAGALAVVAADLLSLALLRPPGELGADVAVGTTQRFGVPMGFGGPHAAYFATRDAHKRLIPGRIVGMSRDALGQPALRLALQTREQHIRRDRATSNICTSQVLLAIIAGMYAVWHGPEGLRRIASHVRRCAAAAARLARNGGLSPLAAEQFDTITVDLGSGAAEAVQRARQRGLLLRDWGNGRVSASFDETTSLAHIHGALYAFLGCEVPPQEIIDAFEAAPEGYQGALARQSKYLDHSVFHQYRSEHELLRYIYRLQSRDIALTHSMIPLGSCTMKLNAAAEMRAVTWPQFANIHPFAPADCTLGYQQLVAELEAMLGEITGLPAVSMQPNAGSQGEYAGLLAIRGYHHARGESQRNICLIPSSAHGTNPASAVMVGMKVVVVRCDDDGNIDMADLQAKAEAHSEKLAAAMVTYPSTHGVFEASIVQLCELIHAHGGQVYMDGANMNAQVGLCRPGEMGADVCHLNLHKTFCIPHGGGGPGMGPICAAPHLRPYLPGHPALGSGEDAPVGAVAAAPFGSPLILVIPWMYIRMMGSTGLQEATKAAILGANYCAARLQAHYPILYRGERGRVAHELILDLRHFKKSADISVADVAKRLMDYGFHAPTVSWPVAGTLMVEPTESESKEELDRFCDALIAIREEIRNVESGTWPRGQNPVALAPHPAAVVTATSWDRPYQREQAAWPAPWLRQHKYWPPVGRIDEAHGDRNLVCTCAPLESFSAN